MFAHAFFGKCDLLKLDDAYYIQRFTRRRKGSKWSAINRDKVIALIAAERMRPPGMAEVEAAQADGRWDAAYHSAANATVPADLQAARDANVAARAFFEQLDRTNRYAILFRIQTVKKAETCARKIAEYVQMLADGRKIHN